MASHDTSRPNVVVILSDDQGYWALGCAGNDEIRTPHLDALAASGMRFDRFYCTSPVCSPARASLLTGLIPSQHGVLDWIRAGNSPCEPENDSKVVEYLAGIPGYSDHLARASYTCGMSGKWHLGDCHHPQKGYAYWRAHARAGGEYYAAPIAREDGEVAFEDRYVTDVITDDALAFLDTTRDDEAPFCLSVNYTAPHSPWDRGQHPPEIFESYFDECPFASVPDEPRSATAHNTDFFDSPERRREKLSGYYAAVTAMDACIGRIMAWLDAHGLRENTLVFFTSDNGMNMGHHGICGKGNGTEPINLFETSVRVPAIASLPGVVPAGVVSDALLGQYDWLPTLVEFAGVPADGTESLPGASFAPLLRGEGEARRDDVVVFDEYGYARMIRTREWKYIHRHPDGPHELYDMNADPGERTNLADDPGARAALVECRERLATWFARYARPEHDGATKAVTGRGQLDRATEPQRGDIPFAQEWMTTWWKPEHASLRRERSEQ